MTNENEKIENSEEIYDLDTEDVNVYDMINLMCMLDPNPPFSGEATPWGCRYTCQKCHMIGWFLQQPTNGTGQYTRNVGNESSRLAYNRFANPGGLLWMAEAFGEDKETVKKAMDAIREAEKIDKRRRCGAFRKIVPFNRILELITKPEGWLLDPALKEIMYIDEETGYPVIKEEYFSQHLKIINDEFGFEVFDTECKNTEE